MDKPNRPKVGPADPATRRKMLDAELAKPTKATGVAAKHAEPDADEVGGASDMDADDATMKKKKKGKNGVLDLLDPKKPRQPTHGGKTLDEVVSAAVDNAPKRPIR